MYHSSDMEKHFQYQIVSKESGISIVLAVLSARVYQNTDYNSSNKAVGSKKKSRNTLTEIEEESMEGLENVSWI